MKATAKWYLKYWAICFPIGLFFVAVSRAIFGSAIGSPLGGCIGGLVGGLIAIGFLDDLP